MPIGDKIVSKRGRDDECVTDLEIKKNRDVESDVGREK